ncbi:keto-deoxy-phosphogluconate aldolase [Alsobacter soli]|uniref:2-dehydro-3-deoxy-phosphogluconate aldolase n=1 Tax=Alsobacter soli TaxID=2109933 RepID=A0A2T1HPN7_9HYPH|nr:keto-deoxy-phosphogluconate aldolase [Alsobacter soli]
MLRRAPVVPVLTIDDPHTAVPLAQALVAGGLPALEITLRTDAALDAMEQIAQHVPDAIVGAGTVLTPSQVGEATSAGAQFLVSPGCTTKLAEAAARGSTPLLPGASTASEAMTLAEMGYHLMKFFPAEPAGGAAFLKALGAPLPQIQFCPTGGIDAEKAKTYLALPNVICVGGSWIAPASAVKAGDWSAITALSRAAAALRA